MVDGKCPGADLLAGGGADDGCAEDQSLRIGHHLDVAARLALGLAVVVVVGPAQQPHVAINHSFVTAAVIVKPLAFLALGIYRRYWLYASVGDLIAIVIANAVASLALSLLIVVGLALGTITEFSRSILLVDLLLTVAFTGGARFSVPRVR